MSYLGPGMYTEAENLRAIGRGEYLKSVAESPDDWCGAVPPDNTVVLPCRYPIDHPGRHEWQRGR